MAKFEGLEILSGEDRLKNTADVKALEERVNNLGEITLDKLARNKTLDVVVDNLNNAMKDVFANAPTVLKMIENIKTTIQDALNRMGDVSDYEINTLSTNSLETPSSIPSSFKNVVEIHDVYIAVRGLIDDKIFQAIAGNSKTREWEAQHSKDENILNDRRYVELMTQNLDNLAMFLKKKDKNPKEEILTTIIKNSLEKEEKTNEWYDKVVGI